MTASDIMKALEMCIPIEHNCSLCPLSEEIYCCNHLLHEVFDLYNRQKAEVERLQNKCEDCAGCSEWKCDCSNVRNQAFQEFADKLIDDINKDIRLYGNCTVHSMALKINNTLKELSEHSVNYESSKMTE